MKSNFVNPSLLGGGTVDYNDLENKPAIDGVELTSQTTKADLGLTNLFIYRGSVEKYSDLPTTGQTEGDVYNVETADPTHDIDAGDNVVWVAQHGSVEAHWDVLGGLTDLSSKQDVLVSGENIKTINEQSILGSGDLHIGTNQSFPTSWPTNTTFDSFLKSVFIDTSAIPGNSYLGELTCSGLPTGLNNAEAIVEIMTSAVASSKCIHVILTSGNLAPYRWEYTAWNYNTSTETYSHGNWISFQPQLTAGDNIQISNSNVISATDTTYSAATNNTLGLVKPDGTTITVNDGTISAINQIPSNVYTEDNLKAGNGISIGKKDPVLDLVVQGSPTITNGVASNFSSSNYLNSVNYIKNVITSFEIGTALSQTSTSGSNNGILDSDYGSYNIRIRRSSTNTVRLMVSADGTNATVDITGTTAFTLNQKIYVKATYDSTNGYALYTSSDGETWTTEGTSSTTTAPYTGAHNLLRWGMQQSQYNSPFYGSIYFADTYINVNGKRVWSAYASEENKYIDSGVKSGNNIVVAEGDNDTLLLCHFDGSLEDSSPIHALPKGYNNSGNEVPITRVSYVGGIFGQSFKSAIITSGWLRYYSNFKQKLIDSQEFTLEFWMNRYGDDSNYISISTGNGSRFQIANNQLRCNYLPLGMYFSGNNYYYADISNIKLGEWFHVALTIKNYVAYIFINGELLATGTSSSSAFTDANILNYIEIIGGNPIDELRISSVARWTSDFEVPTRPYSENKIINCTIDLSTKQDTLVSGTNIKTVNNNSLLGSGNISIDSLPSQTGQSGKFLTTDGTDASWATISALQNTSTSSTGLTIIGTAASVARSINIGASSTVGVGYSTAIGYSATANGGNGTALGCEAVSNGEYSVAIGGYSSNTLSSRGARGRGSNSTAVGAASDAYGNHSTSIGCDSEASGNWSVALGDSAKATALNAIQIGAGTNSTSDTLFIGLRNDNYQLLDSSGTIPAARLPVATTSAVGGVKVDGSTITINNGVISAAGGGSGVAPTVVSFTNKTGTTLATGLTLADYDTILVFKNGILLKVGASDDYTISTNNIVFAVALVSSDIVTIIAMGEVSGGGTTVTKTHRALVSQITSSLNSTGFISLSNTSLMPWSTGNVPWEFEFTFRTPPASDIVPAYNRTYCELVGRATSGDPMPTGMEVLLYNSDKTTYPDKCGVALGLSSTGSSWDIGSVDSGMIFNAFTYYTVKITYDLSKYQVLYKEGANGSFTLIDEFTSSTPLIGTSSLMFGGNGNNYNGLWTGVAIDIANTSMKSGNTVYFGGTDMFRNNNIQFTFNNIVIQEYDEVN